MTSAVNKSLAIFLTDTPPRAVLCTYDGFDDDGNPKGNLTLFKTWDLSIKVRDFVVIPTKPDHRLGFTTAQVARVDVDPDFDSHVTPGWIVGVIDLVDYYEAVAREQKFMDVVANADKRRRKDELKRSVFANLGDADLKALPAIDVTPVKSDEAKTD